MFPLSRNKNHQNAPEIENSEPAQPAVIPENVIARDVRNRALYAVAVMEEAGILPGETINVYVNPEATELGAVAIRTTMATHVSTYQNLPLLIAISDSNVATFQYI